MRLRGELFAQLRARTSAMGDDCEVGRVEGS